MFTSQKLRNENIAEYLLYMWQVEDIIRANSLDVEKIEKTVIKPCDLTDEQYSAELNWYSELVEMMRREGVVESGHLQINKNIIIALADLHQMLLKTQKYPNYVAEFYRTLPFIVELRAKSGDEKSGEIETCFNALYGMFLIRLQHKEISKPTMEALTQITKFISTLATFYHKDKKNQLFSKEDYDNL